LDPIRELNPNPTQIRQEFFTGDCSYGRLFAIIHRQYAKSIGKGRWGIQIGMVEKEAKSLLHDDPSTKIIQMIRNPFERISECISKSNRRKLSLGLETNLWRESARLAKENMKNFPNQYKVVKWENLMNDIDQTLDDICNFLGEDFRPEMLSNEMLSKKGVDIHTNSKFGQRSLVNNYSDAEYRLTRNDRNYISDALRSEIEWFGYSSKTKKLQLNEKLKYLSMDYPAYFMGEVSKIPLRLLREVKKKKRVKRNYIWQKIT
jgi:hypothetical protein